MKFTNAILPVVAILAPLVNAHATLFDPMPYNNDQDNAPLAGDGSNFPCKLTAPPQGYSAAMKTFTPGQASQFTIKGSAVHGGGSCQISVTYDNPPTKNSVFKVVQSYEGGCPLNVAGNLPANPDNLNPPFDVTMPTGLKSGTAVFVWTWFNKIGNREMYMNCAPITIGGSETSDTVFNSLPDMFVANIAGVSNGCSTTEGVDIQFPNPGTNVQAEQGDTAFGPPVCPAGSGNAAPSSYAPAPTAATPNISTQPALVGASSMSQPSVGTVFTPINGPAPTAVMTTFQTVTQTYQPPAQAQPTMMSSSVMASAPAPTSYAPAPNTGNGSNSGNTGNSGSYAANMGTCDPSKGQIICKSGDPTMFAECYDGGVMWGYFKVPPGTTCDTASGNFVSTHTGYSGNKVRRAVRAHIARGHAHRRWSA